MERKLQFLAQALPSNFLLRIGSKSGAIGISTQESDRILMVEKTGFGLYRIVEHVTDSGVKDTFMTLEYDLTLEAVADKVELEFKLDEYKRKET